MVQQQSIMSVPVIWRGNKFVLELYSEAYLKELGEELRILTEVKADTMRLIVPQSSTKSSKLLFPFSDEHSCVRLQDIGIMEGKHLRMMGVLENEVDQVLKDAKANLRIAGFEEEEKRMKQRASRGPQIPLKLPQGHYIFCDFRTLELPGVELNPPASAALKRMHMLAADPGIVAVMNKHRWRVGIMTEMAPVGYVGISPKCILGFNKNHGEEISLRLRTDDLKGFRKYESIKKTLLHELAHMVYSEHDANFFALNKQLNEEAFTLDWTRSRSHTLTDARFSGHDDVDMDFESESSLPYKLGGETSLMAATANARLASVTAAYHRFTDSSAITRVSTYTVSNMKEEELVFVNRRDDCSPIHCMSEPDPDDTEVRETMNSGPRPEYSKIVTLAEPNSDDTEMIEVVAKFTEGANLHEEPDPDDSEGDVKRFGEPDPDDSEARNNAGKIITSGVINDRSGDMSQFRTVHVQQEYDPQENKTERGQPGPDDKFERSPQIPGVADEPDPDDEEIRRIQDPVSVFYNRLTKAAEMLRAELEPSQALEVLRTLAKIIRNISENPNEMKYKRLRKANPVLQRSIAYHKAAMEILFLIGFSEDNVVDESGKGETYLVLKRNDPGLLWLAKSFLEKCIA